jgi:translation initiation factor 2B subunit (eIF-2B alpha/beta/delta family)
LPLPEQEVDLPAERAKRMTKPFEEKSKRAQYAAAKQVRDTHEAPAILLAAAQSQSLAGKKDASFVMRKIGSKTGLTAAKARSSIVKPP